jgi:acetyl esterase
MAHPLLLAALGRTEAVGLRGLAALPPAVMRRVAGRPVMLDGQVLDTETQWMLRLKQLRGEPGAETLPLADGRVAVRRHSALTGGRQPIGESRDLLVPGGDGAIGARLYVPRAQVRTAKTGGERAGSPLLVFLHGGGMIYGDLESHDAVCRFLAERADVRVLALDYRLAPEHPFPAAVDDVWRAYQWVAEHADDLGADPDRLAVGGDSAGGYLAAVLALKAAEAGVPCAFQLLVYPVTNMAEPSESRRLFGRGFYLTDEFIDVATSGYVPDVAQRRDPLVSVAFTEKIPGNLAPAYVASAGFDPLRDEGEAYARRLSTAGVQVELQRHTGLIHGFLNIVGVGASARAAVEEMADRLRSAVG